MKVLTYSLNEMFEKDVQKRKKELPDWLTVTAHNPLYHCGKISHRTQHWMETVTQSDLARNLQPNHEDSIVTQPLCERERGSGRVGWRRVRWKEKIQSINLCPGYWFHRGDQTCRQWITHLLSREDKHIDAICLPTCTHTWLMVAPHCRL